MIIIWILLLFNPRDTVIVDLHFFVQNPYKFFPDERFGDESPIMALRQVGRCRVNSSPAMDSMFTEPEGVAGFHPPLPPPPPPYHPPATPSHAQLKGAWRPRVPMPTPTRSFSYPCNRALSQRHAATKHGSSEYSSVPRPQPPDCTNPQAMGRALLSDQQGVSVYHFHVSLCSIDFIPAQPSWG